MHRSIATVSLSGTLRQKLEAIAAARFDGFELFESDLIHADLSASDVRSLCADLNLSVDLYQPFRDFESMPDDLHRRNLERAERKFDVMQALGCRTVLVCSNTSVHAIDDADRAAAQLHELAGRAARRNLRVGFEALAWGRFTNRYAQAWDIVRRADHPHLGLILDSFHTLALRDDPRGIEDIPGDRIFFLQMADAPLLGMDVLQWARHFRNFPGQGQLDVVGFFAHVLRAGYTGPLSLEIFNDVFRESPTRRTATDAIRSLLFLESEVRRRLDEGTSGIADASNAVDASRAATVRSTADLNVTLFDPPQAPDLHGVAFIEFAVDEATDAVLGDWLRRLGFRRTGVHRSKQVSLYEQGNVRLVVNAQPGSAARERFASSGASVCAIGLATGDPLRAQARATALKSARVDMPRGSNELRLPAIMAPGGTIIQFVPTTGVSGADAFDRVDFESMDDESRKEESNEDGSEGGRRSGAGIVDVDHLTVGLTHYELDTWVLFARSVLGLGPEAGQHDVADPFGLIRKSSVADPQRRLRIALDASLSASTRTARTAEAMRGASVQGLTFRTDDIVATARQLRANGMPLVKVPSNYHDDIEARHDLPADRLAAMRELGILFDRDEGGDYHQLFTQRFGDRFFVEVVQRDDGYAGLGALNAAVRMAADVR